MEEETHPVSGVGEERLSEVKVDGNVQEILVNGDGNPQEQEENKHEKSIPHFINENVHNSSNDLFEAQDKIKVLELQLQTVNEELQNFDSDRTKLKSELDLTIEKLKLITQQYEELQLEHKRTREEMSAEEQKYNLQGVSLQEALKDLDGKHKEVADTKEALDGLTAELENSKKKLEEFALQLEETADQARKFEELNNQNSSHAESQSQRALELEKMMEAVKLSSTEMEHHISKLQEELKVVNHRLEESNQVEEILTATKMELAESLEKLGVSKSHVGELEEELSSKEAYIGKLSQELDLYRNSEDQIKQEKLEFENILSSLKEALQAKTVALEDVKLELEQEIKARETAENRFRNQESQILELHDLLHAAESKVENNEKKVTELELLLEAVKQEKQEMEQHFKFTEEKSKDAEVQLEQQARRVLELSAELQELKENSQRLAADLQSANDKEKELIETLNVLTEERKKHEDLSNNSAGKLSQAEKLIEDFQADLKYTQEKLRTVERDLEVSGLRENELADKIKHTEEQLEHERKSAEQSIARCLELESLHDFLVKDSKQKLEAATASFAEKDSETKQLYNKLNSLEEQSAFYQEQVMETTEKLASLMIELEASAARLASHETTVEELNGKFRGSEAKAEQSFAESERVKKELEESQSKIKELYESLNSIHAEKEAMDSQLLSYLQNITDLTNDRARNSEYQSQIEASIKETEAKLCEALERCTQRDSEARELNEKLLAAETQHKAHEEHAKEAAYFAEKHKAELEGATLKLQSLERSFEETKSRASHFENKHENLSQTNLTLSQKIADYETKVNELEGMLNAITAEKEDVSVQLQSSSKAIEDLSQQLVSEREKLQSQISSVLDENNRTNIIYQDAKEEIEELKSQLQEMQNVHKTTESSLNSDLENLKSQLQALISELEQQLSAADTKHKEEISSILDESNRTSKMYQDAKEEIETVKIKFQEMQNVYETTESSLNAKLENLKEELSQKSHLEAVISELEQKLSNADTNHKEEIEKLKQAGSEKDALLAAKVQQLDDLQKEYNSLIAEQKESVLRMQQEREYVVISSHDELETEQQRSSLLEKQIEELKQKLEAVQTQNKKVDDDWITEDNLKGAESKSRDFELPTKSPSKRKNRKKSGELIADKSSPSSSGTSIMENSGINSLKFFSGVVVVSLFIGVYLGKRY